MFSDVLKRELEAENRAAARSRRIGILVGMVFLFVFACGAFLVVQNRSTNAKRDNVLNVSQNSKQPTKNASNTATTVKPNNPSPTSQTVTSHQPVKSQSVSVVPLPKPSGVVDRAAFIADANKTLTTYGQVISLVNFSSADTDAVKAGRITQAVALDQQNFSQVTSLRSLLASAGVTSGKYMDLTELAESSVAKVSTGLTFMNYWVSDHSQTSDLNIGTGNVAQGAGLLLQLPNQLSAL